MAAIETYLKDSRPDWRAIDFDVQCGRCGYNLRMLEHPRCPECGLVFDWATVLDESAWRSDFLFEHQWRKRPLRSWAATLWRGLRPTKFWGTVSLHDRINAGPLWFLLLTSVPLVLVLFHGAGLLVWLVGSGVEQLHYFAKGPVPPPLAVQVLPSLGRALFSMPAWGWEYLLLPAGMYAMLLIALGTLCSFRQTLGRCQVRAVQVLRVVAYAATPVCTLWATINLFHFAIGFAFFSRWVCLPDGQPVWFAVFTVLGTVALPALLAILLCAGLKRYLRLPRAILLGLAASLIAFLAPITASLVIDVYLAGGWG